VVSIGMGEMARVENSSRCRRLRCPTSFEKGGGEKDCKYRRRTEEGMRALRLNSGSGQKSASKKKEEWGEEGGGGNPSEGEKGRGGRTGGV